MYTLGLYLAAQGRKNLDTNMTAVMILGGKYKLKWNSCGHQVMAKQTACGNEL